MKKNFQISLAAARVNARLSQKEVCKALGVSKNTICNWEKGHSMPDIDQAVRLSKLYGIPLDLIKFD